MKERVVLFGDSSSRPEGLVRALARAGFVLAEGEGNQSSQPDLVLVAVRNADAELERAFGLVHERRWFGVPVIVLLAGSEPGGITRALSLGAADAVAAPVDLAELCARLEARLRLRAEMQRAAGAGSLQAELFHAIEEVASAQRPDDMLEKLVRRLGAGLAANHCACLVPSADGRYARLVAVHENPTLRDITIDLFHYPEVVEAVVSCRTVHAPEVLRDALFLAHLAQWPDSPQVREIESAAAVPLMTHRAVRAVIVIRTRRGDAPLTTEQVVSRLADIGFPAVPYLLDAMTDERVVRLDSDYPGLKGRNLEDLRVYHIADKALEEIFQKVSRMGLDVTADDVEHHRLRRVILLGWENEWRRFAKAFRESPQATGARTKK